jgi:hypothetical protein
MYLRAYEAIRKARVGLADWIRFYNFDRLHQTLGYRTPWDVYKNSKALQEKEEQQLDGVVSIEEETPTAKTSLGN